MLPALLLVMGGADLPPVGADHGAEIARHRAAGVVRFEKACKALGDKIEDELGGCICAWTTDDVPDWGMIGACAKAHADSYHITIP